MKKNPLSEFVENELYEKLLKMGMLNERAIRDYYIRKKFNRLRNHHKPGVIIEKLRDEFPYLSIESMCKIVYTQNGKMCAKKNKRQKIKKTFWLD